MKKNRRSQTQKSRRTPAHQREVLELRRGSRTSPVPSGTVYRRPKSNRHMWED